MLPTIVVPKETMLPDDNNWQFRFNIPSETSGNLYTIGQHKRLKHWGCSCPGWRRHRHCKHLTNLGLPGDEKPFEVQFIKQ